MNTDVVQPVVTADTTSATRSAILVTNLVLQNDKTCSVTN